MIMDKNIAENGPILFFDSGIGGLSVMSAVRDVLPQAPIVYAADYAGLPYGEKSEEEIATRVLALLGRLTERYRPGLIVIACNTACTIALSHVRNALNIPIVGTVPAIKPAAEMTETGAIALLGTQATIRQPYVDRLEAEFAGNATLVRHGAPELVAAAEAKMRGEAVNEEIFADVIKALLFPPGGEKVDIVILGCTHFPLLQQELADAAKRAGHAGIKFVDGAKGIARRVSALSTGMKWTENQRHYLFVTTSSLEKLDTYRPALTAYGFTDFTSI